MGSAAERVGQEAQEGQEGQQGAEGQEGQEGQEFDREKLHPILRDMTPEQINDLMDTMATGLKSVGRPASERPREEEPKAPEPPKPPGDMKDLLNPQSEHYNPEAALDYVVRKNYGGVVRDIGTRTINSTLAIYKQELPDFGDYEEDIRKALKGMDPTAVTDAQIMGMYFQAKGIKMTAKERTERAKKSGATTVPPSAPKVDTETKELAEIEVEVAQRMFRRAADPVAEYKKYLKQLEGSPEMKVPVGAGKKE